jgi:competence protein ComFA
LFICPKCGNKKQLYVSYKNNKPYCLLCLNFNQEIANISKTIKPKKVNIYLNYHLTYDQRKIANNLVQSYLNKRDVLVNAVCGAGKTEIVLKVIKVAIEQGCRVGFIIPRREVVIEIGQRLKRIFKNLKVTSVYGGHSKVLDGDIIVLTAHQARRYKDKFGLCIIDEVDAFPYFGNKVLENLVKDTCYGSFVFMSATPSKNYDKYKSLNLNKRYHGYPVPTPKLLKKDSFRQIIFMIKKLNEYKRNNKPCLVYLPKIKMCLYFYSLYRLIDNKCYYFHSQVIKKEDILSKFRRQEYNVLFTTTILERGITLSNLQVIVLFSNHYIFNTMNLIQIAGRVGRKKKYPSGDVYFLASKITSEMQRAYENLVKVNNDEVMSFV